MKGLKAGLLASCPYMRKKEPRGKSLAKVMLPGVQKQVRSGDLTLELYKDDRRLLVSHTRYLEDLKYKAEAAVKAERVKEEGENQAAIVDVQKKVEKETLGDLSILAQLREQLENK